MPNFPAPFVGAFLVELVLYLATSVECVRRSAASAVSKRTLAGLLVVSAILPYCIYSAPMGCFNWRSLWILAALASVASCWYLCFPKTPLADAGFLALMAGVVLSGAFGPLYGSAGVKLPLSTLGQLMWIRLGVMSALSFRGMPGVGLGLFPSRREWFVGIQHYLYLAPVSAALMLWLKFARFEIAKMPWWMIPLTFVGMFWVVALSEEFFFRGLLLQWLREWTGKEQLALLVSSVAFGLVHLPFRAFPNWKLVILATVAGWFYGRAYLMTGSIRSSMVAHALTVVTWRVLFA